MKTVTWLLALITLIIIGIINWEGVIAIRETYGPSYLAGNIIGTFLMLLLFFWIVEKIYLYIKKKTT